MNATNEEITVKYGWAGRRLIIPKGTPCTKADNLPDGGWWVEPQDDWSMDARDWANTYGIHLTEGQAS